MTWWWAVVWWKVSSRRWAMPWHSMAWRRLVARRGRSSVIVRRIATSGSGTGSWSIPVGSTSFLIHTDVSSLPLMWTELRPIQSTQCILHVLSTEKFHYALSVTLHICKTDISCFPHVILQILPASRWWQSWNRKRLNDGVDKIYFPA